MLLLSTLLASRVGALSLPTFSDLGKAYEMFGVFGNKERPDRKALRLEFETVTKALHSASDSSRCGSVRLLRVTRNSPRNFRRNCLSSAAKAIWVGSGAL